MNQFSPKNKFQHTISGDGFVISGIEPLGGRRLNLGFYSAPPNTGIIYENPRGIQVRNDLSLARFEIFDNVLRTIVVENNDMKVCHIEHIPALLKAFGIDNVIIKFKENYSNGTYILPNFEENELTLLNSLFSTGIVAQNKKRVYFQPKNPGKNDFINGCGQKVQIQKKSSSGLEIKVKINYPEFSGETQLYYFEDLENKQTLKDLRKSLIQFSRARSYAGSSPLSNISVGNISTILSNLNQKFGNEHGIRDEHYLWPAENRDELLKHQEKANFFGNEIKWHGIKDKRGALALLENELGGRFTHTIFYSYKSGHEFDIGCLKRVLEKEYFKVK